MSVAARVHHDDFGLVDLRDSDLIASGGEGSVYSFGPRPDMVAKVYHSSRLDRAHREKLGVMIAYPPVVEDDADGHVFVAWPDSLLRDRAGGDAVGFLMPKVDTGRTLHTYLIPALRSRAAPETSYADLCAIGRHFSETLDKLHGRSYVLGDINESNALVTDGTRATLIDADSFQVTDHQARVVYRCEVGKPEYTAPELQGVNFADVERAVEHDRFALGVVIYQLLMEGQHPFNLTMPGNVSLKQPERIFRGYFAHGASVPYGPEPTRVPFESLHDEVRDMFIRCFDSGHRDPGQRPRPAEWASALDTALSDIERCGVNAGHWRFSSSEMSRASSECVWCERAQTLGFDSFTSNEDAHGWGSLTTGSSSFSFVPRSSRPTPDRVVVAIDVNAKDENGLTPLHSAAANRDAAEARRLVSAGADVDARDKDDWTPLHWAARWDNSEAARVLLGAGADADADAEDEDGRTPLHIAARWDNSEAAKVLLGAGADVEALDDYGDTPLDDALTYGSLKVANLLRATGTDVNAKDEKGLTPLHNAAENGDALEARRLLGAGADVDARDDDDWTPLHYAAREDYSTVATVLLGAGADADAGTEDDRTPLHIAAVNDSSAVAIILLGAGADVEALDDYGDTPLDDALTYDSLKVANLLRAAGGDY